jgi:hypothetical protein
MIENRELHVLARSHDRASARAIELIAAGRSDPRDVSRKGILHCNETRGPQKCGHGLPVAAAHWLYTDGVPMVAQRPAFS